MHLPALPAFTSSMPADWLIIGVFAVVMVILTLRGGPRIACALALSLPLSLFLLQSLSSTFLIGPIAAQFATPSAQAALFGIILLLALFFSFRIVGPDIGGGASPLQSILVGLAATAIALVFWLTVPTLSTVWHFGPMVQSLFAPAYRLWWIAGGLLMLSFARF